MPTTEEYLYPYGFPPEAQMLQACGVCAHKNICMCVYVGIHIYTHIYTHMYVYIYGQVADVCAQIAHIQ